LRNAVFRSYITREIEEEISAKNSERQIGMIYTYKGTLGDVKFKKKNSYRISKYT